MPRLTATEMIELRMRLLSRPAEDPRADAISVLVREVSDLRCILREIRDLTSEDAVRDLAASRLVQ